MTPGSAVDVPAVPPDRIVDPDRRRRRVPRRLHEGPGASARTTRCAPASAAWPRPTRSSTSAAPSHAYTWHEFAGALRGALRSALSVGGQAADSRNGARSALQRQPAAPNAGAFSLCRVYSAPAATFARAAATIRAYFACSSMPLGLQQRHLRVVQLGRRDHAVLVRHLRRWSRSRAPARAPSAASRPLRSRPAARSTPSPAPAAPASRPRSGRARPGASAPARPPRRAADAGRRAAAARCTATPNCSSGCRSSAASRARRPGTAMLPVNASLGFHSALARPTAYSAMSRRASKARRSGRLGSAAASASRTRAPRAVRRGCPRRFSGCDLRQRQHGAQRPGTACRPRPAPGCGAPGRWPARPRRAARRGGPPSRPRSGPSPVAAASRTGESAPRRRPTPCSLHQRAVERLDHAVLQLLAGALERRAASRRAPRAAWPVSCSAARRCRAAARCRGRHDVLAGEARLERLLVRAEDAGRNPDHRELLRRRVQEVEVHAAAGTRPSPRLTRAWLSRTCSWTTFSPSLALSARSSASSKVSAQRRRRAAATARRSARTRWSLPTAASRRARAAARRRRRARPAGSLAAGVRAPRLHPLQQAREQQVGDRHDHQRQHRRGDQPADRGNRDRRAELAALAAGRSPTAACRGSSPWSSSGSAAAGSARP